ncbi:MAG: aspartate--tRNA ligase, partial [Myxococcota bacterium]
MSTNKDQKNRKKAAWNATHHTGELRAEHAQQEAVLCGWILRRRDHGRMLFLDLNSKHGVTQVTCDPDQCLSFEQYEPSLRLGACLSVRGKVLLRTERGGTPNPKLATGDIEVLATQIHLFSPSKPLPFPLYGETTALEETRLKYRYLDLRRGPLLDQLQKRSEITYRVREYFRNQNFVDVETPCLTKSTPEGARDYLVPSRVHPERCYALPQSPQLYKQLLMIGGLERYIQIARCFRDEDQRADRQLEFTQIDFELSFVEVEQIYALVEGLFAHLFQHCLPGQSYTQTFPRLTYEQAMLHYGEDKPDLRYEVRHQPLNQVFLKSDFRAFSGPAQEGLIKGFCAPQLADRSRSWLKQKEKLVQRCGAKGLAWCKVSSDSDLESPIARY